MKNENVIYPSKGQHTFRWIGIMPLGGFWVMSGKPGCHKPVPIRYGTDTCSSCKLDINDRKLACEWITADGKPYRFDSIACMVSFLNGLTETDDRSSAWVSDFTQTDHWIPAEKAIYLHNTSLKANTVNVISAYANDELARSIQQLSGGIIMNWQEIRKLNGL